MSLFNTQEAEIVGLIVEHLAVEPVRIERHTHFARDLGADSLDMIQLSVACEHHFGIEISDDEEAETDTVDKMFKLIATATAHEADASIRPVR